MIFCPLPRLGMWIFGALGSSPIETAQFNAAFR